MNPLNTRPAVEITVEAQNRSNAVALHDSNMEGVAGRHQRAILGDLPGTQNLRLPDGDHFVDDIQRNLQGWSDRFSFFNSRITMENLLQHFSVGNETLPRCNQALQDDLCIGLVWVRRSD